MVKTKLKEAYYYSKRKEISSQNTNDGGQKGRQQELSILSERRLPE